jgi:hypothetical protein
MLLGEVYTRAEVAACASPTLVEHRNEVASRATYEA